MKCSELNQYWCVYCYCHYWLTMFLLVSSIVNVLPDNITRTSGHLPCENGQQHCSLSSTLALSSASLLSTEASATIGHKTNRRAINEPMKSTGRTSLRFHAIKKHLNTTTLNTSTQIQDLSVSATKNLPLKPKHHHRRRQIEEEQIDKCRLFVDSEPGKNELYSPDYPYNYPRNINCTKVITAPKGQIIRLDFRNSFHIEDKEECKFDFLEIRDGQYGFSNLIGKYCGTDFPPEITSKERYLWLHFHSDESIEYSGFTAVYEFLDRSREAPSTDLNCTIEKDGYEGFVNSTDVPAEIREVVIRNKIPLDCMWRIQVQDKWKIQVKFLDFKLSKPNDCETNFLDIFPEQTVIPRRVRNFCGSAGEGLTSESNVFHMRFYAEQIAINSTFAILYTAFRDRGNAGCTDEEYDCEDATCISKKLYCNGRDNCKFRWDEESCDQETAGQSEHMIIIIVVFGLILGGMVITFLVNCIRKIMRDQKIIREHIRQSKESKLDEMGHSLKGRSRENLSSVAIQSKQKHSGFSLENIDNISNHYYREVPPQTALKHTEQSILRQHDIYVQTSLCGEHGCDGSSTTSVSVGNKVTPITSSTAAVADMASQTRESLFGTAPLGSNCTSPAVEQSSQYFAQNISEPRIQDVCQHHQKHHSHLQRHQRSPAPPQKPANLQQQPQAQPQQYQSKAIVIPARNLTPSEQTVIIQPEKITTEGTANINKVANKPKKKDESKLYIDVRNSAPDVIIMTSH